MLPLVLEVSVAFLDGFIKSNIHHNRLFGLRKEMKNVLGQSPDIRP